MLRSIVMLAMFAGAFGSPVANAQTCAPFTDVAASNIFCSNIQWMLNRGVTQGCGPNVFCPADLVTREQMAAFMNRLADKVVFQHGGNAFGAAAELGTLDDQALEVIVNNGRVMRYEPNAISPNVIGGSAANGVTAGVRGATIGGGGVLLGDSDPNFINEAPNRVTDAYGTVGGGYGNRAGSDSISTIDAAFATVGGGSSNVAGEFYSVVSGGVNNSATGFVSTIGGGTGNSATGQGATVAGGSENDASASLSTVAGGQNNTAGGSQSTVGGGFQNTAGEFLSTVAGGSTNTASGSYSAVPGGLSNVASGSFSFAAGVSAKADQHGCFVFSNWASQGSGTCLGSTNVARFTLDHGFSVEYHSRRADGGGTRWVHIGNLIPLQAIATSTGAFLSDTGIWTNASDRALKDGFAPVDARAVLDGVINLPISRWHYRHDGPQVAHIGPTAQDFKAAFGLGHSDTGIGTVDADGVALVAIQALNAKLEAMLRDANAQIADLRRLNNELRALVLDSHRQ